MKIPRLDALGQPMAFSLVPYDEGRYVTYVAHCAALAAARREERERALPVIEAGLRVVNWAGEQEESYHAAEARLRNAINTYRKESPDVPAT